MGFGLHAYHGELVILDTPVLFDHVKLVLGLVAVAWGALLEVVEE